MDDITHSPDETTLARAARAALLAEVKRTRRGQVFDLPDVDQVIRLLAAAWPVLATCGGSHE